MILRFTVPGPPAPKERARVVRRKDPKPGQRAMTSYTPDKTVAYENHVKLHALAARCRSSKWEWQNPDVRYSVKIEIFRSTRRGDWDNFAKAITDACKGVTWPDDRQIAWAFVKLNDCAKGRERAEVEFEIVEVNQ